MRKKLKKLLQLLTCCFILIVICITGYNIKERLRINALLAAHQTELTLTQNATSHHTRTVTTAIQQIMIGTLCNTYEDALQTLQHIKAAGYDAIELNDFMIQKTSPLVKLMTQCSGMPIGNGGTLDWPKLIAESGLKVISLHSNLTSIENDAKAIANMAKNLGTNFVVITGMYGFDYSNFEEVGTLAHRLNQAGKALLEEGVSLLYHNHNCELQKVTPEKTAYDLLIEATDPKYVNFEFDSYWIADGGANVPALMEKLGDRIKLWHINDRGHNKSGPYMTPILKENATELGYGNMDLDTLTAIALKNGVKGIVLETHNNWIDNNPIKSLQLSAAYLHEKLNSHSNYN